MKFRCYDSAKFKLTLPMICSDSKFNNESFLLPTRKNIKKYEYLRAGYSDFDMCQRCNIPIRISCSSSGRIGKEGEFDTISGGANILISININLL